MSTEINPTEVREQLAVLETSSSLGDRQLVEACLLNDTAAWAMLYHRFHEPLLGAIRAFRWCAAADASLIDEIAARVWYALLRNRAELLTRLKLDTPNSLIGFLSLVAKNEARQYFRAERRRRDREERVAKSETRSDDSGMDSDTLRQQEFLGSLSPTERNYFETMLAPHDTERVSDYSDNYAWQLRYRLRKKLSKFCRE